MTLTSDLNRLAGTTDLSAQGAANVWAGTTDLSLVGALNAKAGNTLPNYLELQGVLNQLAGTTDLGVDAAAAAIVGTPTRTPTTYQFSFAGGSTTRMTEALTIRPSDGRVMVIASAGRIWEAPAVLSTSEVNIFTMGAQLTVTGNVTGASWSPDGLSIAVITRDEFIYIFDTAWVQQSVYSAPVDSGNTEAICWSADGSTLYFCYDNAGMTGSSLYSMVPGAAAVLVGTLPVELSQISGLTPSLTQPNVLYGILDYSSGGDRKVYVIDATNATVLDTITLLGATNVDWEDIEVSHFDGSIWVGDHGNYGDGATLNRGTHQLYRFTE